ncbi:uncharacterized protein LOC132204551 isoform X2 [Neocloeon triangulifer]|uniref:uncharacterized protein LOC132204551 isoform X2 n=1 Tax=Neocloeon triangulifer TaxID=2078957 RepID=UPI00286F3966|nr:uncharacterized protein LOC132204551 isoform X2 [Neocloeon triangulifer]
MQIWSMKSSHRAALQLIILVICIHRSNAQCFGGTETYEKTTGVKFVFGTSQGLLTQPGTGITRDCTAICRQTPSCAAFSVDYENSRCQSYTMGSSGHRNSLQEKIGSNFYEKICLRGVSNLSAMCGDRLWAFERVLGAYLEGFDDREERNVQSKTECEKLCLFETSFTCRSAEYDETQNICRLSREDRRSQPNAFRRQVGGNVDYLENQCVRPLPDCRYHPRPDNAVLSMDELQFAASQGECEALCDQARGFTCRAFTYAADEKRCYLSGDDSISLNNAPLMLKRGALYAEKQCSISQCEDGMFTFEKVTGHFLRSAQQVGLSMAASPGVTLECSQRCLESGSDCPAFTLDYAAMKCFKLDRNTQGRTSDLAARDGQSYFEKICIRGNIRGCQGRAWAFERRPGKELRGHDDAKAGIVQSRRDCMEACLGERRFECRSAEYDSKTSECKLSSEDRRSKPNEYVDAPPHIEYLENQCIQGDFRGCNFEAVANSYPRYLDLVIPSVSDEMDCERRCYAYKDFICRSFSYYPSGNQCFLSGDDRASAGNEAMMTRPGTNYYERNCRNVDGNMNNLPPLGPGTLDPQGTLFGRPSDVDSANRQPEGRSISPGFGPPGFRPQGPPLPPPPQYGGSPGGGLPPPFQQGGRPPFIDGGRPPYGPAQPTVGGVRCPGRLEFEKVTGFELTGERGYSLARDRLPGITLQCARRCQNDPRCAAFNIDYRGSECVALTVVTESSRIDLRPTPGVAYFEGICLRGGGCGQTWTFERYVNYELRGFVNMRYQGISKIECQERCLEDRVCRSATYNFRRRECFLSTEDRFSQPQAFIASVDTDYMENQCAARPSRCVYRNQQRDLQLMYVDKSLSAFSDSSCQQACDVEREFVCRSFTFLSQTGLNTNQCLLSGDTGVAVGRSGFVPVSGALFAERECSGPPGPSGPRPVGPALPPLGPSGPPGYGPPQVPPRFGPSNLPPVYPSQQYPPLYGNSFSPTNNYPPALLPGRPSPQGPWPGQPYPSPQSHYQPPGGRYASGGPIGPSALPPQGPTIGGFAHGNFHGNFPMPFPGGFVDAASNGIYSDADLNPYPCRFTLTYEKVAGATYTNARRDPIRTWVDVGITAHCLVECAQQRDRCMAVSLENVRGGRQRCYALDRSADGDNQPLQAAPDLGYFQKICLRERPCPKAWAFTRVPGFELALKNALEVRNVYSRRQCQDECLRSSNVICRSATYYSRERICKISADTRRTQPEYFKKATADIDYMENECAPQPANCEYSDFPGRFMPYSDRYVARAFDVTECRRLCDQEREFQCRSFNFHPHRRECFLSSDDTFTADKTALLTDRDFFYSERGSCSNVKVDCTQSDMLITFMFAAPFEGRVYATGNPQACFELGSAQNNLVLRIPMGTQCGTVQQGRGRYVNHVVIQQNPVIMQETDKTVRVECSFDASDQTLSFSPQGNRQYEGGGISVSVPFRPSATNIVTNTAPTPQVSMRIVTRNGQVATAVGLGEDLQLRIEIDPSSAFGIFARNLEARTENGELLTLIDNTGCPRDPNIFPGLFVEQGTRNLYGDFKAFRFPSTSNVNFVVSIHFCQDICEPVQCYNGMYSFGKRRRRDLGNSTQEVKVEEEEEVTDVPAATTIKAQEMSTSEESSTSKAKEQPDEEVVEVEEPKPTQEEAVQTTKKPAKSENKTLLDSDALHLPPGYPTGFSSEEERQLKKLAMPSPKTADEKENEISKEPLPSELPLQLRLVVGEDSMPTENNATKQKNSNRNRFLINPANSFNPYNVYPESVYSEDGFVCTPSSTIIASVFTTVFFNVGLVAGFVFFYRTKKKQWQKLSGYDNTTFQNPGRADTSDGGSGIFSPEVLFRSVYDRLPARPSFSNLQSTIAARHAKNDHEVLG